MKQNQENKMNTADEILAELKRLNPEYADNLILSKSKHSVGLIVSPGHVSMIAGQLLTGKWAYCEPHIDITVEQF